MSNIYLHMFPAFIFIGLYISIETKPTVDEPENPFQVSNKKLESGEEIFNPNNDYFDLLNFNRQNPNSEDRKYEQQELVVGNRSEINTHEVVRSHVNESIGNLENKSVNNEANITTHVVGASNEGSEVNSDTNPKRSNEYKSSIIKNESSKRDRKERKNFKHSNKLRKIRLRAKIGNNSYENLNKRYRNSDDKSKNYLSDEKDEPRKYKGSNNLRQILNSFKLKNYELRNLEKYVNDEKDSISEESDESLDSSSFSKPWDCSEENKSECRTDSEEDTRKSEKGSEENVSESEADSEESEEPNRSGQDNGKYSNSIESYQDTDKSGHLKSREEQFEIERNDNLNVVYPDKSFEGESMSIQDDEYPIKNESRRESNEDDKLNKNRMSLSFENEKQTNSGRSNYKYQKNNALVSNEKHLENGIYGSNRFVADNLIEKEFFRRQKKLNFRKANNQASGNPEDEYFKETSSELRNLNKRIKDKFLTSSGEQSSTTKRLYYVKVSCENCKIRSKIILHNSTDTNLKTKH